MSIVNRIFNGSLGITQTFLFDPWSAAAAAFGSIVNAHTQNKNTDKMIAAQREENERAYQRNIEQWERENDYNTPTAVAQRLRDAGMNPALAYGTPNVSSPSPQATPTDVSSLGNKRSVLGTTLESPLNAELIQAQIGLIKSEENKNNSEADVQNVTAGNLRTYHDYQDALYKKSIEDTNARVSLNLSQAQLNDMNTAKGYREMERITMEMNKLEQETKNLEQQFKLMTQTEALNKIQLYFAEPRAKAELHMMYSQAKMYNANADLTFEQFEQLSAQAVYNLAMAKTESENLFQTGCNIKREGDLLDLQINEAEYHNEHKAGLTAIGAIGSLLGGAANLASGYYMYSLGTAMNRPAMGRIGFK